MFKPLPPEWSAERLVEETSKSTSLWIPTFPICFVDTAGKVALTKKKGGTPFLPQATLIEPDVEKVTERGWRSVVNATLLKRTMATFGPAAVFGARNAVVGTHVARVVKDIDRRDLERWPNAKGIVLIPAIGRAVVPHIVPNPKVTPFTIEWREPSEAIGMLRVQRDHNGSLSTISQHSADCLEASLDIIYNLALPVTAPTVK